MPPLLSFLKHDRNSAPCAKKRRRIPIPNRNLQSPAAPEIRDRRAFSHIRKCRPHNVRKARRPNLDPNRRILRIPLRENFRREIGHQIPKSINPQHVNFQLCRSHLWLRQVRARQLRAGRPELSERNKTRDVRGGGSEDVTSVECGAYLWKSIGRIFELHCMLQLLTLQDQFKDPIVRTDVKRAIRFKRNGRACRPHTRIDDCDMHGAAWKKCTCFLKRQRAGHDVLRREALRDVRDLRRRRDRENPALHRADEGVVEAEVGRQCDQRHKIEFTIDGFTIDDWSCRPVNRQLSIRQLSIYMIPSIDACSLPSNVSLSLLHGGSKTSFTSTALMPLHFISTSLTRALSWSPTGQCGLVSVISTVTLPSFSSSL